MVGIDPYHSAAMLSLGEIKCFVFARQASARCEFSSRLTVQKQSFFSPETQHGRRVIRIFYQCAKNDSECNGLSYHQYTLEQNY